MKSSRDLLNEIYSEKILSNWVTPHTIFASRRKINLRVEELFDKAVSKLKKNSIAVLDIGCYYGGTIFYFLGKYMREDIKFHGIDSDAEKIDYANNIVRYFKNGDLKKKVTFSTKNIEKSKLDKKYDIILCVETIEHVHDVEQAFRNIFDSLNPGGFLIISTPNKENALKYMVPFGKKIKSKIENPDSVKGGYAIAEKLFGINIPVKDEDEHWSVMSLNEIKHLLKKTGFFIGKIYRGSMIYGGSYFDRKPLLTATINFFDAILDIFHVGKRLTYDFIILAGRR